MVAVSAADWREVQQAKLVLLTALDEPDPAVRAGLLIRAIDLDEENSDLAVSYLVKLLENPKIAREVAPKLGELARRQPQSLLRSLAVQRCFAVLNYPLAQRLEWISTLEQADFAALNSSDRSLLLPLYPLTFHNLLQAGAYDRADALLRKLADDPRAGNDPLLLAKACCYAWERNLRFFLAFPERFPAAEKEAAELWDRTLASALATESPGMLVAILTRAQPYRVVTPELLKRCDLPEDFAAKLWARQFANRGEVAALEKLFADQDEEFSDIDKFSLRFDAAVNSGDFGAAQKLVVQLEDPAARALLSAQLAAMAQKPEYAEAGELSDPLNALSWLLIAESCASREIFQRVIAAYPEKFWESDPEIANAAGYVGVVVGDDLTVAKRRIELALKQKPDNAAYLDSLAWVNFRQGNFVEAKTLIDRALSRVTRISEAFALLNHAGDIESALGNREAAIRRYQQVLHFEPENPAEKREIADARAKLEKLGVKP